MLWNKNRRALRSQFVALFALLLVINTAQAAEFELQDRVLTVRTARYVATFEKGCLSSLANRLTGEVYASRQPELARRLRYMAHGLGHWPGDTQNARLKELRQKFHFWQGGYGEVGGKPTENLGGIPFVHHPADESEVALERLGDRAVRVTWQGLRGFGPGGGRYPDETYTLRLEVAQGSGDLLIDAASESKTPGVYAIGFGMTGFSRNLNFIMPLFQGCAFRPANQPPFRMVSRWPSPFNSSLVVAEGERGSVAMWMADPELGDRHFHFHNTEDAFDVMFYSINQMPFERHREATSRPIRLNVYEGNWVRAARPYRDWWETTFDVQRLEEKKPDWIDEIGWRSGFGREMPPTEIGPQCIYFAPQAWKVQPEIGDGGLFPYEMKPGPQLSGRFKPMLPRVRETGAHVMVYYNINHMNEGHPLAPKFWEHRINRGFGTPREERKPEPNSRRSFLVNTACRPWQDLLLKWIKLTHRRFDIRGFYMDCASGHPNGGRIDGRNDIHGQIELMKRIKRQIPGAFLGVEYLGEATGQVTDQASWGFDGWFGGNRREGGESLFRGWLWRAKHAHPIVGFLYNPYLKIHVFGNGLATPTFHEVMGRIATAHIGPVEEGSVTDYAATTNFKDVWVRLMCREGMRPIYPTERWPENVRAFYSDGAGNSYRVESDIRPEARMIRTRPDGTEELLYRRIRSRSRARLPEGKGIRGWVAYDDNGAIGLNPLAEYFYQSDPRHEDWRLTGLPDGVHLDVVRPYKSGLLVLRLGTDDDQRKRGEVTLETPYEIETAFTGEGQVEVRRLESTPDGKNRYRLSCTAPGFLAFAGNNAQHLTPAESAPAVPFYDHPVEQFCIVSPHGLRLVIDPRHRPRNSTRAQQLKLWPAHQRRGYADYVVSLPQVPDGKKLRFRCRSTISHWKNNGYVLSLLVNGRPVMSDERNGGTPPADHVADLTKFAGQTVLLTIKIRNRMMFSPASLLEPRIVVE